MRRIISLLMLLGLVTGLSPAFSQVTEEVQNYTYDFTIANKSNYSSLDHNWAPKGWGHLVDKYEDYYSSAYVDYYYREASGVDGSPCISVGSQELSSFYESYSANDLLVTPAVEGKVTLMIKGLKSYDTSIRFFKVTEQDGKFAKGDTIAFTTDTVINEDAWSKVTMTGIPAGTRIGIRGNNLFMDNFTAEKASIVKKPALTITDVEQVTNYTVDADADGNFTLQCKAVITNTGMLDLKPGDKGYSLTLLKKEDSTAVAEFQIAKTLSVNQKDTVPISTTLNIKDYPAGESSSFILRENVSGTYGFAARVKPIAYAPMFALRDSAASALTSISDSALIDFGMTKSRQERKFIVSNAGAKALHITSITLPEGFLLDGKAPLTVKAHESDTLGIILDNSTPGTREGMAVFKMDELADFHLHLKGAVIDSTQWYVDFEGGIIPPTFNAGSGWTISTWPLSAGIANNSRCIQENEVDDKARFVTPPLDVKKGETFSFQAGKISRRSYLNVYYSNDATHWSLVKSINDNDTTAAENHFSDEVIGMSWDSNYALKTFTLKGIPTGRCYLAFEAGGVHLDNLYGFHEVKLAHNIQVTSLKAPKTATVNEEISVKASIKNANDKKEEAGSYEATLTIGNESFPAEAVELAPGSSKEYAFRYTPHNSGKVAVFFNVTTEGFEAKSVVDTITVNPESTTAQRQVGIPDANASDANGIINPYYKKSQSVSIYTRDQIALPKGTVIHGITYKGYCPADVTKPLKLFIRNSSHSSLSPDSALIDIADTANFTKVYEADYTIKAGGEGEASYSSHAVTKAADLIHIAFTKPFVYEGNSIEIAADANGDEWKNVSWELVNDNMKAAGRHSDSQLPSSFTAIAQPVIYLDIDVNPSIVSGKITSQTTGKALQGVLVKMVHDNVEYADTTKTDGSYKLSVVQTSLSYQLQVTKDGYTPYFKSNLKAETPMTINVALADANGFYVIESDKPSTAVVNHSYTASATALNTEASGIAANDYKAELYFDGEKMAEAKTPAVAKGERANYSFSFTPHKAGIFSAYVAFTYKGRTTYSDTTQVEVKEEASIVMKQVNDSTSMGTGAPLHLYYKHSESELVYTARQLGLNKGSKIYKIVFRGYSSNTKQGKAHYTAYIENTTDTLPQSYQKTTLLPDTANMTKIADKDFDFAVNHGDGHNPDDMITLDIPNGFVYTGNSIRLAFHHDADDYVKVYFVSDDQVRDKAVYRAKDAGLDGDDFGYLSHGEPVAYFSVENKSTVSGKVVNAGLKPVADAQVRLLSGDVLYSGNTDNEGNYRINVAQTEKTYDIEISAKGFRTVRHEAAISFADSSDVVFNDTLHVDSVTATGIVLGQDADLSQHKLYEPAPLENVTVTAKDSDGTVVAETKTDTEGKYSFSLPASTTLSITCSLLGYNDTTFTVSTTEDTLRCDTVVLKTAAALGISEVNNNGRTPSEAELLDVYTIGGEKVASGRDALKRVHRGVYIIRFRNGSTKKITVK